MQFVKRNVGRVSHKALSAVGQRDGTVDIEFNQEVEKFKIQFKAIKKLSNEIKEFIKAFKVLGLAQNTMNQGMSAFIEQDGELYPANKKNNENALKLDHYRMTFDENIDKDVIAPLNARLAAYSIMKKRIKERQRRLIDLDRFKADYKATSTSSSVKPDKLQGSQKNLEMAKHSFDVLEEELLKDLTALHNDRVGFFDPCFATLMKMQQGYFAQAAGSYGEVTTLVAHIDCQRIHQHVIPITPEENTMANPKNVPPFVEKPTTQPYGQPTTQPYGQPTTQPYGQPTTQPYGQPTTQPYGQPTTQSFGQPLNQSYGQPLNQSYGQPLNQSYGQPAPQSYGVTNNNTQPYGQPSTAQPMYGQPQGYNQARGPPAPTRPSAPPTPSKILAKGLYPFIAGNPSELGFQPGDTLTIMKQDGEWWTAELGGRVGLIPYNYVQLL